MGLNHVLGTTCRYQTTKPQEFQPIGLRLLKCHPLHMSVVFERKQENEQCGEKILEQRMLPLLYCLLQKKVDEILTKRLAETDNQEEQLQIQQCVEIRSRMMRSLETGDVCPFCLERLDEMKEVFVYLSWTGHLCGQTAHMLCNSCVTKALKPVIYDPDTGVPTRHFSLVKCSLCFSQNGSYTPVARELNL